MKLRLIRDASRPAAANMAVDESLLRAKNPVLRIYGWSSPAISIGYFQEVKRVAEKAKGQTVVRRLTGGGLVRHGHDVTLSLTVPGAWLPGDVKSSYLKVNEALRTGFREMWPALDYAPCKDVPSGRAQGERICFEAPACYDLLLGATKVVGASQRRIDGAVLHQSAIFLPADAKTVARKIVEGFERMWGASFEEEPLTEAEIAAARAIELARYSSAEWIFPANHAATIATTSGSV
jgi:lipoate-protein ligase A